MEKKNWFLSEGGHICKGVLAISKMMLIVLKSCPPSDFMNMLSCLPFSMLFLKKYSICISVCFASWVEFLLQRPNWTYWRGLFLYPWFQLHLFTIFLLKGISECWVCGYEAIEQISTATIIQIHLQSQSKLFSFWEGKRYFLS